jgi:hypothetical protein
VEHEHPRGRKEKGCDGKEKTGMSHVQPVEFCGSAGEKQDRGEQPRIAEILRRILVITQLLCAHEYLLASSRPLPRRRILADCCLAGVLQPNNAVAATRVMLQVKRIDDRFMRWWRFMIDQSVVRMLNPDPLWVWLLTRTSVMMSVVPGETTARARSRNSDGIVTRFVNFLMSGARVRPTLAVEIHSRRPLASNLSSAE